MGAEKRRKGEILKTLPHSKEPIYNIFDKDGKYLGSTVDKEEINQLLEIDYGHS